MNDREAMLSEQGRGAVLSDDGLYRYQLSRQWGPNPRNCILWVMLNPSTADADSDDPTIRRCIGFSRRWGFDALKVVNLYALRCTRPVHLEHHPDPVGPDNEEWIAHSLESVDQVVFAWGAHKPPRTAPYDVVLNVETIIGSTNLPIVALGWTQDGHPRHPLYVKGDSEPLLLGVDG